MTMPSSIPSLTLFINTPTTSPSIMATIKAISPLLVLGFLSVLIKFVLKPHPKASPKKKILEPVDQKKFHLAESPKVLPINREDLGEAVSKILFSCSMQ